MASSKQTVSAHVGRQMVQQDSAMIALKPGMAPTLNGIGQRHAVDRFAGFLEAEVLTDILIDIRRTTRHREAPRRSRFTAANLPLGSE